MIVSVLDIGTDPIRQDKSLRLSQLIQLMLRNVLIRILDDGFILFWGLASLNCTTTVSWNYCSADCVDGEVDFLPRKIIISFVVSINQALVQSD